jgi:hypothetical protein
MVTEHYLAVLLNLRVLKPDERTFITSGKQVWAVLSFPVSLKACMTSGQRECGGVLTCYNPSPPEAILHALCSVITNTCPYSYRSYSSHFCISS